MCGMSQSSNVCLAWPVEFTTGMWYSFKVELKSLQRAEVIWKEEDRVLR